MTSVIRLVIAGSRSITNPEVLGRAMRAFREKFPPALYRVTEVVSGGARGVDQLGERWAIAEGIPIKTFPADWNREGKVAGLNRNRRMASYANALLAIWDGHSGGTANMIAHAVAQNLHLLVVLEEQES